MKSIWNQYEINMNYIYILHYILYIEWCFFDATMHFFHAWNPAGAVRQVWVALPIWPGWWGKPFGKWWGFPHRAVSRVNTKKNMTHALRNYSRVSTRLWNKFFWNNFQGIIFEGGRYTIMHVGIWKSWSSPSRYPGIIRFWNNFW